MKMMKPSVDSLNLTKKGLREALSNIVVKTSEAKAPKGNVKVDAPKIDTSRLERTIELSIAKAFKDIKIPAPIVTVQPATVKFPKMPKMPKNLDIKGPVIIHQDPEHPMQVQMVDNEGIPILPGGAMPVGGGSGGGGNRTLVRTWIQICVYMRRLALDVFPSGARANRSGNYPLNLTASVGGGRGGYPGFAIRRRRPRRAASVAGAPSELSPT